LILASVLFACSVISPALIEHPETDESEVTLMSQRDTDDQDMSPLARIFDRKEMSWLMISGLIYLAYLFTPNPFIAMVTVPLSDLFAPFVFSAILYMRLLSGIRRAGSEFLGIQGKAADILLWIALTFLLVAITLFINICRNRLRWRKTRFDITSPSLRDKSFRRLMLNLYPLFYTPHNFRICADGIIIVGWYYIMAIPISAVQKIHLERHPSTDELIGNTAFLATSSKRLIRLTVKGLSRPLFISPKKHSAFMMYIQIARRRARRRK
jgi:hypothetical protein